MGGVRDVRSERPNRWGCRCDHSSIDQAPDKDLELHVHRAPRVGVDELQDPPNLRIVRLAGSELGEVFPGPRKVKGTQLGQCGVEQWHAARPVRR